MAYYRDRGDGLLEVVQDDGSVSPGLPPSIQGDLEAQGILPERPEELGLGQSGATAGRLDYMDEWSSPDAPLAPTTPAPVAPRPTPPQHRPPKSRYDVASMVQAPTPEEQADLVPPDQVDWSDEPPRKNLVGGERSAPVGPDPRERTAAEVAAEMQRGSYYVAPREARDVLVGYTEQGRAPLPEEQLQQRRDNMAAQAAEQRWQGELVGERLEREQEARYVDIQQRFQQVERERALAERREANVARLRAEADQAKADIEQLNPRQLWDEMGGEQRFFAILSVALGGFAAGFTGSGRNPGLEMLQQAQRENLEAQKQKIAQQEGFYSEATAAYERALEAAGGDERAADLIYEIGMGRIMVDQARNYAMGLDSDIARSEVEQLAAQLEEQNLEKEAELQGLTRVRAAQFAHQEARAGGVVRPTYEQALERVGKRHELERKVGLREAPVSDEDRERMIVLPGGQRVYAPAKDDRKVLREQMQGTQKMLSAIEFQESIIDTPAKSLSLEKRAESEANARVLGGFARNLLVGPGAVTDSERAIIEQAVAQDAAGLFSLDTSNRAALRILKKYSQQELQGVYDQLSSTPTGWTPLTPPDTVRGRATKGW